MRVCVSCVSKRFSKRDSELTIFLWLDLGCIVDVPRAPDTITISTKSFRVVVDAATVKSSQVMPFVCRMHIFHSIYLREWLGRPNGIVKWIRIHGVEAEADQIQTCTHTHTHESAVIVFSISYYWFKLFSFIVLRIYDVILLLLL